jgi:hypothetical protein
MVRALLEGRKTMTRRKAKLLNLCGACPADDQPWQPGDRIWVRECWSGEHWLRDTKPSDRPLICNPDRPVSFPPETWYWADGGPDVGDWERPRPSIHMPRWASRLTLLVKDVRVERLQEISEDEAKAEGCTPCFTDHIGGIHPQPRYQWGFRDLWNSLHGAGAWDENPWVAVISFDTIKANIDGERG